MDMKYQKGFSLIELLVVVIVILIIAAIAIPSLLISRRSANQASAVSNLRSINTAQQTYLMSTGNSVSYGSLAALNAAGLIDSTWTAATVTKSTYTYNLTLSGGLNAGFCMTATSASTTSGANSYAVSHRGIIYELAGTTAPNCSAATGLFATGNPID